MRCEPGTECVIEVDGHHYHLATKHTRPDQFCPWGSRLSKCVQAHAQKKRRSTSAESVIHILCIYKYATNSSGMESTSLEEHAVMWNYIGTVDGLN